MNKIVLALLPVNVDCFKIKKTKKEAINILNTIISNENNEDFPFKGKIIDDIFKFSKRDISRNIRSEIRYMGEMKEHKDHVEIKIKAYYKVLPAITYLILCAIFSTLAISAHTPISFLFVLLPYLLMVIKMKIRAIETKEYFDHVFGLS